MRCNIVDPMLLTDQHLIAERRELRMIPPLFQKRLMKFGIDGVAKGIPENYCLGKGHMLFWMNKGKYLSRRYDKLTAEMEYRGFNPDRTLNYGLTKEARSISVDYLPNRNDLELIIDRIIDKIRARPDWYRYSSRVINTDWYIRFLINNALDGT